jgi:TRAP-type C4-dicarboxylate transport system permease small subunit
MAERATPDPSAGAGSARALLPAPLDRLLGWLCGGLILGLTGLTAADVILRYWFNAPVSGAFELTEIMLAALIFAALPLTTDRDEHVTVDLVDALVPARGQRVLRVIGDVVSALALGVFAWRLTLQALQLMADGTRTFSLSLPMHPLAWFAALGCALSAVLALAHAAKTLRR